MDTFSQVMHPHDLQYQIARRKMIDAQAHLSEMQLERQIQYLWNNGAVTADTPKDQNDNIWRRMNADMHSAAYIPDSMKAILDSTGGGTSGGSVMIRQDLEVPLYLLFVKKFPFFDALRHGPANGLVHAANQVTAIDNQALGSSLISTDVGVVNYFASTYNRVTFPIAIFAQGRGVSIREAAAVQAGGSAYNPAQTELGNAMYRLATDIQNQMFMGNASTSAGAGAATELGTYNAAGFDGLRSVLGSVGTYTANNAVQTDIGNLNILETVQFLSGRLANNGGNPDLCVMGMNAKQAFDTEQQGNQRYNTDGNVMQIIPGVNISKFAWANGTIGILPVPGLTLGTYTRTSDNATVEDIYVLDTSTMCVRWLYADNFTVLQIPAGVDGVLSNRWIIFGMFGLEIAAPLFCGKARRLAS